MNIRDDYSQVSLDEYYTGMQFTSFNFHITFQQSNMIIFDTVHNDQIWLSTLCQALINCMVQYSNEKERLFVHNTLQTLFTTLVPLNRYLF